jgi:hypothetical protein
MWETLLEGKGEGKHNLGIREKKEPSLRKKQDQTRRKAYGKFKT